jgi:hypothetical protein
MLLTRNNNALMATILIPLQTGVVSGAPKDWRAVSLR